MPKGVHGKRDTEQTANAGHNNVRGQKHRPAHSFYERKHLRLRLLCCHPTEFYSDSVTTQLTQSGCKMLDETITFLSHMPYFAISISSCDGGHDLRISLKINWRKRVRVERTDDIRDAARRF